MKMKKSWTGLKAERPRRLNLLYYLSFPLSMSYSGFNVFRYLLSRGDGGVARALDLVSPRPLVDSHVDGKTDWPADRDDGPASHAVKAGTRPWAAR